MIGRTMRAGPVTIQSKPVTDGDRAPARIINQMVDISALRAKFNHMVEQDPPTAALDAVFHALGDPTRRAILRELSRGERSVGELAAPFDMSLAAASKHIRALESAGLIRRDIRGRTHLCRLEPGPLADAHHWLAHYERFWTARLDILERLLREEARPAAAREPVDRVSRPATKKGQPR